MAPLTDTSVSGEMLVVVARAVDATAVAYSVEGGPTGPMTFNGLDGLWHGEWAAGPIAAGRHNVTVTAIGGDGSAVADTAWRVLFPGAAMGSGPPDSNAGIGRAPDTAACNSGVADGRPGPFSFGTPRTPMYAPVWGVIGDGTAALDAEYAAGIRAKVVRLSWREYLPEESRPDSAYIQAKRAEFDQVHQTGFALIADLGLQDAPSWVHEKYADSFYVNQFGEPYGVQPHSLDAGDANLIFNPELRVAAADYLQRALGEFGQDFAAVRLGGGRFGELTYPPNTYRGRGNLYWAFDGNARAESPTPGWLPGQRSSHGEARAFVEWYLDSLVRYELWQIETVRRSFAGPLMLLMPSWGLRPGQLDEAVGEGLAGLTTAERNGEVQRGIDFARQIAAIDDPGVVVTTTWLDADASQDSGRDPRAWSPVRYLAWLTRGHPLHLRLFGENTGQGNSAALSLSIRQVQQLGLLGMAWYREEELLSGHFATLDEYSQAVANAAGIEAVSACALS